MTELKKCPFCGQDPRTEVRVTQAGGDFDIITFSVVCGECGTYKTVRLKIAKYATFSEVEKTIEQVMEIWNRRMRDD